MTDPGPRPITNRPERPHLQRVPPHDLELERMILGGALLRPETAALLAATPPDTFYKPAHQTVADLLAQLHTAGHPTDIGTVGAEAKRRGLLDTIGGYPALTNLVDSCGDSTPATVTHWLDRLHQLHRDRQKLAWAGELAEAVYQGVPTDGIIARLYDIDAGGRRLGDTSWDAVNLAQVLAGEGDRLELLPVTRADGTPLLYRGVIHSLNAESESGKSWLALDWARQLIHHGEHVLYFDHEDRAAGIVDRLLRLGVTPSDILDRFHYVRPDEPVDTTARARIGALIDAHRPALAVIDGVTESMVANGLKGKDNDEIAAWQTLYPRHIARQGVAVLLIDHVVKDKEQRGRWAIGGQHKTAGVTLTYTLERLTPFAPGIPGTSKLINTKDRDGQIKATCHKAEIAGIVHYDPTPEGGLNVSIVAVGDRPNNPNGAAVWQPTGLMEKVSRALEDHPEHTLTVRALRAGVKGRGEFIDQAVDALEVHHHIRRTKAGIELVTPYREPADEPTGPVGDDMEGYDDEMP